MSLISEGQQHFSVLACSIRFDLICLTRNCLLEPEKKGNVSRSKVNLQSHKMKTPKDHSLVNLTVKHLAF